jgi:hypothetical protein
MSEIPFINGINFQTISNAVIDVIRKDPVNNLKNGDIIWCKTDFLGKLFSALQNHTNNYILISHCSDHDINERVFSFKPTCIKKWYAQNVNYKHPDLIPLPIGVENHEGPNKGATLDVPTLLKLEQPITTNDKVLDLLYSNFSLNTHYNRPNVHNIISKISYNGVRLDYYKLCKEMQKFLYIASPRGNGIDCHRTWEALYLGCIPIVEKHLMYDTYDLPIIQIEKWEDVTPELLKTYANKTYQSRYAQLDMAWWNNRIQQEAKQL